MIEGFGPGFFGKVPGVGDFVSRALPAAFLEPWEAWLEGGMTALHGLYGRDWPEMVRQAPAWRFALESGGAGPRPVTGVMVPGWDRSGRVWPLTVAVSLPGDCDLPSLPAVGAQWFLGVENAARGVMERGGDADALDDELHNLEPLSYSSASTPFATPAPGTGWRLPLLEPFPPMLLYPGLVREMLRMLEGTTGLWWSLGNAEVPPAMLVCPGLPEPRQVPPLFSGQWPASGWEEADTVFAPDWPAT